MSGVESVHATLKFSYCILGHYNIEPFTELLLLCHEKCNMNSSMKTVEFIDYRGNLLQERLEITKPS